MFVESIFYVGKGKNSRSMQHLKDAKDCLNLQKTKVSDCYALLSHVHETSKSVVVDSPLSPGPPSFSVLHMLFSRVYNVEKLLGKVIQV